MNIVRMKVGDIARFLAYVASTRENAELGQYDTEDAVTRSLSAGAGFLALDGDEVVGSLLVEVGMFGVLRREHARDDAVFAELLAAVEEFCRNLGVTRLQNLADDDSEQRRRLTTNGFTQVDGVTLIAKNL